MKKILGIFAVTASILFSSCSKENEPSNPTGNSGIYRVSIEVIGNEATGHAHIMNIDKVNIKNETTGQSSISVDEDFKTRANYVTEEKVEQILIQGLVHSNEKASIKMTVTKDGKTMFEESKNIDPENGTEKVAELRFTTISQ